MKQHAHYRSHGGKKAFSLHHDRSQNFGAALMASRVLQKGNKVASEMRGQLSSTRSQLTLSSRKSKRSRCFT